MTSTHWCLVEPSLVYQHSTELASVTVLHDNICTCFCEAFMHYITYIVCNKKCALHFYPPSLLGVVEHSESIKKSVGDER
jgi:hypothetical protein